MQAASSAAQGMAREATAERELRGERFVGATEGAEGPRFERELLGLEGASRQPPRARVSASARSGSPRTAPRAPPSEARFLGSALVSSRGARARGRPPSWRSAPPRRRARSARSRPARCRPPRRRARSARRARDRHPGCARRVAAVSGATSARPRGAGSIARWRASRHATIAGARLGAPGPRAVSVIATSASATIPVVTAPMSAPTAGLPPDGTTAALPRRRRGGRGRGGDATPDLIVDILGRRVLARGGEEILHARRAAHRSPPS